MQPSGQSIDLLGKLKQEKNIATKTRRIHEENLCEAWCLSAFVAKTDLRKRFNNYLYYLASAMKVKQYYRILGVTSGATLREIKAAYRKHALRLHPDVNPGDKTAEEEFLLLQEAYTILSDEEERRRYDGSLYDTDEYQRKQHRTVNNYFKVTLSHTKLRVNSEFYLTYWYTGSGRQFIRPSLSHFFMASKPLVSSRKVVVDGETTRETAITFVLYPLFKGVHTIGPATIRLDDVEHTSASLSVEVLDNICYFNPKELADGKPYRIRLRGEFTEQTIVIPRSKRTAAIQTAGTILKLTGTAAGILTGIVLGKFIFLGLLLGSAAGGMGCLALYNLTGIQPKHFHSMRHPLVTHYFNKGYYDAALGDAGNAGGGIITYLLRVAT